MSSGSNTRSVLKLISGAIVISFAPILVRATEVPPTTSAFYRMLIGGLVLGAFVYVRRLPRKLGSGVMVPLVLAGLCFAFDLFFWHRSIFFVGPGLATLLAGFQVFVLALVGVLLLSERLTVWLVLAIGLALTGVALIVAPDWQSLDSNYRLGVVFGLLTAVAYASVLLCLRWVRVRMSHRDAPMADVVIMSLSCAVFLMIVALINQESLVIPDYYQGLLLLAYAVTAQLGWVLIAGGLSHTPVSLVGLILLLEPTFAYIWELLIFTRPIDRFEVIGVIVALCAIYLGTTKRGTED